MQIQGMFAISIHWVSFHFLFISFTINNVSLSHVRFIILLLIFNVDHANNLSLNTYTHCDLKMKLKQVYTSHTYLFILTILHMHWHNVHKKLG